MSDKQPLVTKLEPGTYYWCSCGRSNQNPFCDGSHTEKDEGPLEFTLAETKTIALCNCKKTGDPPFCDGAHLKE